MSLFVLEGWGLSFLLPFHRRAHQQELHSGRSFPLDGLRGVLAVTVFFTHVTSYYAYEKTSIWDYPPSNFYSQAAIFPVTMFFFITAYLFWSKLIANPLAFRWNFLLGRFGRLMPAYFFACCLLFLLAAYASHFHRQVSLGKLGTQIVVWSAFWGNSDINGVNDSKLWFVVSWTLRYEWLFYFSLPFVGWFARRKKRAFLLLGIAAALGPMIERFSPATRLGAPLRLLGLYSHFLAFTFSIGILVALLPKGSLSAWAKGKQATVFSLICLGYVLFFVPPKYGLLESLFLAFPFACICMGNSWFGLLSSRPFLFLGRISYSFYLLHQIFLSAVLFILKRSGFILVGLNPIHYWLIAMGCGMFTILICAFSYQLLEAPFLHVGKAPRALEGQPQTHAAH